MAETDQPTSEEKKCTICEVKSEERGLLRGESQDKKVWVCIGCLPSLIHSAH